MRYKWLRSSFFSRHRIEMAEEGFSSLPALVIADDSTRTHVRRGKNVRMVASLFTVAT
jgi:hypothetical protein